MTKRSRSSQDPPIDLDALAHLEDVHNRAGDAVADILIRSFANEVPRLLEQAKDAARQDEWSRLSLLAANMRSASALIGARNLVRRCLDLEQAARSAWADRARRLIVILELELARALRWLAAARPEGAREGATPPPAHRARGRSFRG